jgi:hypothetical protein
MRVMGQFDRVMTFDTRLAPSWKQEIARNEVKDMLFEWTEPKIRLRRIKKWYTIVEGVIRSQSSP